MKWILCDDSGPPHLDADSERGSTYKWGDTSLRSRSQSLRDSVTFLSLGKLYEDHWYSHESASEQKHSWPKRRRQLFAERTRSYLLLFKGYPSVLIAYRRQHRYCRKCLQQVQSKSEMTDKLQWTDTDHIQKSETKTKKRDVSRDTDDYLRYLPKWLEECTDNLEDTEVYASAHISQDSHSERPTKVLSKSRKHSIFCHFPKEWNLGSLLTSQNDKDSL